MTRNITAIFILLPLLAAAGCDADDDGDNRDDGAAEEGDTGDDGPDIDVDALYACEEEQFIEFRPLVGPGWSAVDGLTDESQDEYIVHGTQIYTVPEKEGEFITMAQAVADHADASPALVGFALAGDPGCGVNRTMGVWKSVEGMYEFAGTGAHLEAMGMAGELSYSGRVTHWTVTREELLEGIDWDDAREHLADVPPSGLGDY